MKLALFILFILVLYLLPALEPHPYVLHVLVLSCLYAIPAIGLNLMLGYTGLVSLGHMAFAGIGAYTAAVLMVDAKLGFWIALPLATLTAGAAGFAVGAICLRFRTHYFMIVTLAFGLLLHQVMNNWDEVTRGAAGFPGIPRPAPLAVGDWSHPFGPLPAYYRLALTALLVAFAVQWIVVRSEFGSVLAAIRQDERLAAFKGANAMLYKNAAFAIGSAIAGFGGVFFVSFLRAAAPDSFTLAESINMVLIVIIGGAGYLLGPILGALVYIGLPEYLRAANELRLVLFGIALVLITLFAPQGLAGLLEKAFKRARGS
ncbi:MAG TPA: branched-chain amino acid ABC transporter permease [Burkholderiales bacterium]